MIVPIMDDSYWAVRGLEGKKIHAYCDDGEIWFPAPENKANSVIQIISEGEQMYMDVPDDLEPVSDELERRIGLFTGSSLGSDVFDVSAQKQMLMGYLY